VRGEVNEAVDAVTDEAKKRADEVDYTIGVLQSQLDVTGAELRKLETDVTLARSEVMTTKMKAKAEVAIAQS